MTGYLRALSLLVAGLMALVAAGLAMSSFQPGHPVWWGGLAAAILCGTCILLALRQVLRDSRHDIAARLDLRECGASSLLTTQDHLQSLLETCPIGIMIRDEDGMVRYCNPQQATQIGRDRRDIEGQLLWSLPRPDAVETDQDKGPNWLISGAHPPSQQTYTRPDGTKIHCLVSHRSITFNGQPAVVEWWLDFSQRHQAEEAMRVATHLAEMASRAKTDFLASMSHELRTPLNAICGFTEMMQAQMVGPLGHPAYLDYCGHILDSAHHLTDLINDVLDVAALETGKVELFERRVTVERLFEAVKVMIEDRLQANEHTLVCDIAAHIPALMVDERRIKQVLINILVNAVKFTPKGGRILLQASTAPDQAVCIMVQDNGIGIAADDLAKVLQPFVQIRNSMVRTSDGVGIGLPLANSLMQLHGGSLTISSDLGAGTSVSLLFPSWRSLDP